MDVSLNKSKNLTEDRPFEVRARIRQGYSGLTTGMAAGFLQGNLVILPSTDARQFVDFCEKNSGACPILGISEEGSPHIPALGTDLDLRTDVGRYVIYRDGVEADHVEEIGHLWQNDFVSIVLGCWFSAEAKLAEAGVRMRHLEMGIQGGLFRTTVPCKSAGPFETNLVASMRPFRRRDIETVVRITSALPLAHGAPIHVGDPARLGIADLGKPDFGEQIIPIEDEEPVFWACGVTSTLAIAAAELPIAITHLPGRMVVTDLLA